MKQLLVTTLLCLATALTAFAQKPDAYTFKEYKRLPATPVKSQDQTGTCWAFSTTSFLESEALRLGKGETNLSEMFTVRNMYREKCENYVRRQGSARFSEGGLAHDKINAMKRYGLMPESAYPGRKDPSKPYNHSALEKNLRALCDGLVKQAQEGKLPANWLRQVDDALDAEFGKVPLTFEVGPTQFTATSYRDYLGLNADDYVTITSFTHHPFYQPFILEIPDNFANGTFYNLPLHELTRCANYSLDKGYTVEWDADVSNAGFSAKNGLAIVPEKDWDSKTIAEREGTFKTWEQEKSVTQESRQQLFDQQITQDDHLMHIVGMLDEAHTGLYYVVKNSWGEISDFKGYVYVSEAYMRLNTISFTVHKNALPTDIRKRLGFEPGEVIIPAPPAGGGAPTRATAPANSIKPGTGQLRQGTRFSQKKTTPTTTEPAKSGN